MLLGPQAVGQGTKGAFKDQMETADKPGQQEPVLSERKGRADGLFRRRTVRPLSYPAAESRNTADKAR